MNWIDKNFKTLNYLLLIVGAGLFGAALVGLIRGCLGSEAYGFVCYQDAPSYFVATVCFYGVSGLFVMGSIFFQKQFVDRISQFMGANEKSELDREQSQRLLDALDKLDESANIKKLKDQLKHDLSSDDDP